MDLAPTLYGLELDEIKELMQSGGHEAYRADQLADWLYHKHIREIDEATNLPPSLKEKLSERYRTASLQFFEDNPSATRESIKYLFKTQDDRLLECVLIRQKKRRTVCVSTQLGCKIGCVFCASGKGRFGRDLTCGEIIEQVVWIEKKIGESVSNVVFMGMGEPFDNFEATMKALKILQAEWGFGLGGRRITVSTSGITPKIVEFVKRNGGRVRLSVSLHSSIESKRTELVPINKRYPLKELVKTISNINQNLKRFITFEYTLIKDQNDSEQEAQGVAKIAGPLDATVNLIPYNPIREMDFETPEQKRIDAFRKILTDHGVRAIVRQTVGQDINAACGQLRLDREEHQGNS